MAAILMMAAKLLNLGLLRKRDYDVIISVHDVTNNILSCDSYFTLPYQVELARLYESYVIQIILIPTFVKVTWGKLVGDLFAPIPPAILKRINNKKP